jgi:hypothetical protein
VREFLGEVDLEVSDHLAAGLSPALDGWVVGVLDQVDASLKRLVEILITPLGEGL